MPATAARLDIAKPGRGAGPRRAAAARHRVAALRGRRRYPVVAYPAQQEDDGEEQIEETIYAGLVFPYRRERSAR